MHRIFVMHPFDGRYMAPELLRNEEKSHDLSPAAVDIYSFGLTMFAVLSQSHPYRDDDAYKELSLWSLRDEIVAGDRPVITGELEAAPYAAVALMKACWQGDPNTRPSSFRDVCKNLLDCLKQQQDHQTGSAATVPHSLGEPAIYNDNPMFNRQNVSSSGSTAMATNKSYKKLKL